MSPGAMLLQIRQKYGHGLRAAYWRDVARPRILRTRRVEQTCSDSCEIHLLTCSSDWLNAIWTLKTFYWCSGREYRLCIHEDGSLTAEQRGMIQAHFPNARIVDRRAADARLVPLLSRRPRSESFRTSNPLALKVFDFAAFLECDRMLLLDSDILFFECPTELLRRIDEPLYTKNSLNKDWAYGYTAELDRWRGRLEFDLPAMINSGLGLLHKDSLQFDWFEDFLGLPEILGHHHQIEQTIIALCSAKHGFEFLPSEYNVCVAHARPTSPCRHYTGPIRHLMYRQGIRHLVRSGILRIHQ